MPIPLLCLVGYVLWTVLLVIAIGAVRVSHVLAGRQAANAFPSGSQHGGDRYWRLNRAHINATENLALYASVVIVGALTSVSSAHFQLLAEVALGARVLQSLVHIASGSVPAVNVRFFAFVTQIACVAMMALEILRHAR